MELSVIIPCLDAGATIGEQLEALARQEWSGRWEVIVADNGSRDDTLEVVERYRDRLPALRVIDASRVRGAAHARNAGAKAARAQKLAFVDADDVVAPGWVAAVAGALDRHELVASRWDTELLNTPEVRSTRRNGQADGLQAYKYPQFLPHAGGCGLAVRRSAHEAVGGFDETLPCLEDTDYCWRVQLSGRELAFAPDALVHIRFRATASASFQQAVQYGRANVRLHKIYRSHGMPSLSWRSGLGAWLKLARQGLYLPRSRRTAAWLRQLGWRLGRLIGSIRYRIVSL